MHFAALTFSKLKIGAYQSLAHAAVVVQDRYSKSEVKFTSVVDVQTTAATRRQSGQGISRTGHQDPGGELAHRFAGIE